MLVRTAIGLASLLGNVLLLAGPCRGVVRGDEVPVGPPAAGEGEASTEASAAEQRRQLVPGWYLAPELHASGLSNQTDRSVLSVAFGWGARAGYRNERWGAYVQAEHDAWLATELGVRVVPGSVNFAAGAEYLFAGGFARSAMGLGVSVLVFDTQLHRAGSFGLYYDLRPIGLRWPLSERLAAVLDPLHLTIVAPVLDFESLVNIEYRCTGGLEVRL